MKNLKSSYLNSIVFEKIENFDGGNCFLWFFFVYVKFHGQIIIKCETS